MRFGLRGMCFHILFGLLTELTYLVFKTVLFFRNKMSMIINYIYICYKLNLVYNQSIFLIYYQKTVHNLEIRRLYYKGFKYVPVMLDVFK